MKQEIVIIKNKNNEQNQILQRTNNELNQNIQVLKQTIKRNEQDARAKEEKQNDECSLLKQKISELTKENQNLNRKLKNYEGYTQHEFFQNFINF